MSRKVHAYTFLSAIITLVCNKILATSETSDAFSFLIIGDWGKGGESGSTMSQFTGLQTGSHLGGTDQRLLGGAEAKQLNQLAVAKAMAHESEKMTVPPEFVVALGDNFYTKGVSSYSDSLWDSLWKNVYINYDSLKIPWYAVFGNHDYGYGLNGVKAQIERNYLHEDDDLWRMESTNYTKIFRSNSDTGMPNKRVSVQILFIDTTTLAPSSNECCNIKGGVSYDEQARRINDQLDRIEKTLEDSLKDPPTWLLVAGHYPIFSLGDHGDNNELVKYLWPLLEKYGVHAYLSGHDHISEHLVLNKIEYFVIGAGCMTDSLKQGISSQANLKWSGTGYSAFATMEASLETLNMRFIDTNGDVRYEYTLNNPKQQVSTDDQSDLNNSLNNENNSTESPEDKAFFPIVLSAASFLIVVVVAFITTKKLLSSKKNPSSSKPVSRIKFIDKLNDNPMNRIDVLYDGNGKKIYHMQNVSGPLDDKVHPDEDFGAISNLIYSNAIYDSDEDDIDIENRKISHDYKKILRAEDSSLEARNESVETSANLKSEDSTMATSSLNNSPTKIKFRSDSTLV